MRLLTTKIEGFGPHDHYEIDWATQGDLVAIVAPNGAGKTFLIEADFACLYGDFPSYGGSLYDALTQNSTKPGVLTTDFEIGGTSYQAIRTVKKTAKTATQTAELFAGGQVIAGPKVRDFDKAVEDLLGPKHLALASWFSTQGTVGDLANLSAADRRDVFESVLDMGRLTEISEKAKAAATQLATEVQTQERQIKTAQAYAIEIAAATEQLSLLAAQRTEQGRLAALEEKALAKMTVDLDRLGALKDAHETTQARAATQKTELAELTTEQTRLQTHLDKLRISSADLDELQAAEIKLEEAEACIEAHKLLQQWTAKHDILKQDLQAKKEMLATLQEQCRVTPEEEQIVADLSNRRKALAAGHQAKKLMAAALNRLKGRIEELQGQLSPDVQTFHDADPPADACHTCVLHRNSRRTVLDLTEATQELELLETAPEQPLEALEEALREAEDLERRFKNRPVPQASAYHSKVDHARSLLEAHASSAPPNPECSLAEASHTRAALQDSLHRLRHARTSAALQPEYRRLLDKCEAAIEQTREALAITQEEIREYDDREYAYDLHLLTQDVEEAKRQLSRYRHEELHKAGLEGSLAQQLETLTSAQSKDAALVKTLKRDRKRIEHLKTIQQAFGKRGVQAVLIDQAVETLETHCNQFLQAVGGGLQLAIVTQTETRDGRNKESLEILVTDPAGTRPVGRLSGGERRLISTVLRLGITLWASQLSGRACSTLRIDEAFDALDDTRSREMITLLSELQDVFDQIVVITHNHNLATQFPARITL